MRLQTHRLDRALLRERLAPPPWRTMDELDAAADAAIDRLRTERLARARGLTTLSARLDAAARTDTLEHMDRDDLPPALRQQMVRQLYDFTRVVRSHPRFIRMMRSTIHRLAADAGRPVRALELASGSGELALALTTLARRRSLPVTIDGSDVAPPFVELANQTAARRGLPTRFSVLNAFDLEHAVEPGRYALVFIVQAAHHFTPGQLARMIAQARRAGARTFVAIDGRRSLRTLVALPLLMALYRSPHLVHDGWISARRFYADAELELIAATAAPDARQITVHPREPGFVQLIVDF